MRRRTDLLILFTFFLRFVFPLAQLLLNVFPAEFSDAFRLCSGFRNRHGVDKLLLHLILLQQGVCAGFCSG